MWYLRVLFWLAVSIQKHILTIQQTHLYSHILRINIGFMHRQKKRSASVNKLTGIYLISKMKRYKAYKHYIVFVEHFTSSARTKRACFVLSSCFCFIFFEGTKESHMFTLFLRIFVCVKSCFNMCSCVVLPQDLIVSF